MFVQREASFQSVSTPMSPTGPGCPRPPRPPPLSFVVISIHSPGQGLGRCFPPSELPNMGWGEPLEREALGFALGRWDELWAHHW